MEKEISTMIKDILVNEFYVQPAAFDWNTPLFELQQDFELLANLVRFEQLLQSELNNNIALIENINAHFHSPADVLQLVKTKM